MRMLNGFPDFFWNRWYSTLIGQFSALDHVYFLTLENSLSYRGKPKRADILISCDVITTLSAEYVIFDKLCILDFEA